MGSPGSRFCGPENLTQLMAEGEILVGSLRINSCLNNAIYRMNVCKRYEPSFSKHAGISQSTMRKNCLTSGNGNICRPCGVLIMRKAKNCH